MALFIGGLGASTQHPLASALMARAFDGPRSMKALGTYNFAGDIGKMTVPAAASLLLVVMAWRPALALLGVAGLRRGRDLLADAAVSGAVASAGRRARGAAAGARAAASAFPVLLSIGMLDSATRMGFLLFLPFVLTAKGASLPTIGLALTLVFAGGAAGKLVCAFIGARIGAIATVWPDRGLTAVLIVALLPLPLEAAFVLLPVIGIALNGTSSVLYGSVPDLVASAARARLQRVLHRHHRPGAVAPGRCTALSATRARSPDRADGGVAGIVLLTLPLSLVLRPMLPATSR